MLRPPTYLPAPMSNYRTISGLLTAERTTAPFGKARGASLAQKDGLRYEKKVGKELFRHATAGRFVKVEHNPWFAFEDDFGPVRCSPDFLLHSPEGLVVVEVKLTWIEVAIFKINDLYIPVVELALGKKAFPLVICRNLTPSAPPAKHTLREALNSPQRLLHWPEIGGIVW